MARSDGSREWEEPFPDFSPRDTRGETEDFAQLEALVALKRQIDQIMREIVDKLNHFEEMKSEAESIAGAARYTAWLRHLTEGIKLYSRYGVPISMIGGSISQVAEAMEVVALKLGYQPPKAIEAGFKDATSS